MGLIGAGRIERQEKCVACQKTFLEDELELRPYPKTGTVELMCISCRKITPNKPTEVPLTTEKKDDKNKIITEKKPNLMKEAVNNTKKEIESKKSMCGCAKFPLCKAVRATQAFDEFSNSEIRAYFISAFGDYYKIDFCPFCGKRLYKQ